MAPSLLVKHENSGSSCLIEEKERKEEEKGRNNIASCEEKGEDDDRAVKIESSPVEIVGICQPDFHSHDHQKRNFKREPETENHFGDKVEVCAEFG